MPSGLLLVTGPLMVACLFGKWAPAGCWGTGAESRIGRAAALGPSWGRETAVTHGQPRSPADSRNRGSTAISAVMRPKVRIWHARGHIAIALLVTRCLSPS